YTNFPAAKKLIENALERSQLTNQPVEARNVRLLKEKTFTSSAIQTTNENKEMQGSTSNNSQINANLDSNNLSRTMLPQKKHITTTPEKSFVQ
ncbi:MAG TPA: hypothetical protein DEA34_03800, partial [Enterococcus sp.]|nr:hypothetical protein [Enterococcus sp.]